MSRVEVLSALTICLICFSLQCSGSTEPTAKAPARTPAELSATELQLAVSINEFGIELFKRVAVEKPPEANVFISPLSAAYALAMAYNGATGETRQGIESTLVLTGLSQRQVNSSFAGLTEVLTGVDQSVTTGIANAVWYSPKFRVVDNFQSNCQAYFDATVKMLDFGQSGAADTINNWVAERTNDRIKQLVKPPLEASLASIIANAVYFKAPWTFPFDTTYTRTDSFFTSSGEAVSVDFMGLCSEELQDANHHLDNDATLLIRAGEFMAFTLPYGDRWYRMSVFLPDTSTSVEKFIASLTSEKWQEWRQAFKVDRFDLRLPKFKFSSTAGLNDVLSSMGMKSAFDPAAADFSQMVEGGGIWIDKVLQKAFVQVDEKGTDAAAATLIIFIDSLSPYIDCNRPFVFVIWEKESGAILFIGKIAEPVWEDG